MKIAIWSLFVILLALWTGASLLTVGAVEWLAANAGAAPLGELRELAARMPAPAWLVALVDREVVVALQSAVLAAVDALDWAAPQLAAVVGWLVPLVWGLWFCGGLVLLALAGGGHWLVGLMRRREGATA